MFPHTMPYWPIRLCPFSVTNSTSTKLEFCQLLGLLVCICKIYLHQQEKSPHVLSVFCCGLWLVFLTQDREEQSVETLRWSCTPPLCHFQPILSVLTPYQRGLESLGKHCHYCWIVWLRLQNEGGGSTEG